MVEKNTAIGRTETTTAATAIVKSNWKAKIEYTFLMKAHRSCGLSSIIGYRGLAPTSTSFFLYGWVHIFKTFLSLLEVCLDAEKVKDKASFFFFFVKEEMSFECGRGREGKRCNNKSGFGETRSWETSRYVADFAWNDSVYVESLCLDTWIVRWCLEFSGYFLIWAIRVLWERCLWIKFFYLFFLP